ncbi:pentatricopeptide repeat-containing protein At2g39620 [Impatiens glandulifera]|uniref:pentatricopeptide repeat-containing protein At2g39620 n=1 Tax=Impatiens glandulifera TaxID=253017 RepID=UPI001FB1722B|nr:pentatricopeptide repeat-containing protein At2g39620 [Impatiens glandulifera]XP_047331485.1 pentatricopeptide repeat-containing protein At2g39620 [Impatiens glandulifera]
MISRSSRLAPRRIFSLHSISKGCPEVAIAPSNPQEIIYHHHPYIISLLSSCTHLPSIQQIHALLIISGFKPLNLLYTHLINSYASLKRCDLARSVFNSIPNPCTILWNSIIRAYTRSNQYKEALELYRCMLDKYIEPDKYTFTFVLKACTGNLNAREGISVHQQIISRGIEGNVFVGTGLIDMYCKMGDICVAREVFDRMPEKDVTTWNAMIGGLSESSSPFEAMRLFFKMQTHFRLEPSSVSLLNLFSGVCQLRDIRLCRSLHGFIVKKDFPISILNGLIDMYSKCERADIARMIFNRMRRKDDFSWGSMMAGHAHNGNFNDVLELYDQLSMKNLKMNKISLVSAVLAAAETRELEKGKAIHECAIRGMVDSDILVATPLIKMYVMCEELQIAKTLFSRLKGKDIVTWSSTIAAFVQSGYPREGLSIFRDMLANGLKPNRVTIASVLPACSELLDTRLGMSIHCYSIKIHVDSDISTATGLVSMYSKSHLFTLSMTIFNRMSRRDVVTWNALITAYAHAGDPYRAAITFADFRSSGEQPDYGTMAGFISACAMMVCDLNVGNSVYGLTKKFGFESDRNIKNALIDMYAKLGSLSTAEFFFNDIDFDKDEVSWNAVIAGYVTNRCYEKAMSAYYRMKLDGFRFKPNIATIMSVVPAIANLADIKEGMSLHSYVIQTGLLSYTIVKNSLIDMYSKCGRLDSSERIFSSMGLEKDLVSWNTMLAAYAVHGEGDRAVSFFSTMQEENVEIDSSSFLSVLSACRHMGLVEEARRIFDNCEPGIEHYACMVDLLGRAGLFDESLSLIREMKMEPDGRVWGALLIGCRLHSNVKLGEMALDQLRKLDEENSGHYVALSSLYSESGRWVDARNLRIKMNCDGLKKKTPGLSWVDEMKRDHLQIDA